MANLSLWLCVVNIDLHTQQEAVRVQMCVCKCACANVRVQICASGTHSRTSEPNWAHYTTRTHRVQTRGDREYTTNTKICASGTHSYTSEPVFAHHTTRTQAREDSFRDEIIVQVNVCDLQKTIFSKLLRMCACGRAEAYDLGGVSLRHELSQGCALGLPLLLGDLKV